MTVDTNLCSRLCTEDLQVFFCWNQECPKHGIRGEGNVRVRFWYGKNSDIRLLYCVDCNKRFSERRGTVLFGSRLTESITLSILGHIADGAGVRQTERWTKVHRSTVIRLKRFLSELADAPIGKLLYD